MKTLNTYLSESLNINDEELNEGIKDDIKSFIKKFALTAAIATSCLASLNAKPTILNNMHQFYAPNNNTEIVQQSDVKEKDVVTFEGISLREHMAENTARAQAYAFLSKNHDYRIVDVKSYYNSSKKLYKRVYILVPSNTTIANQAQQ